jgi:hypothetical protein
MTAAHRWTAPALTGAILACLAAQALLAFRQEANWDEFYYLSFVHDYQADRLTKALQTIHVHLFGWLPRVGVHELRQIGAGRLAMLACEGGTIALIYRLARLFATRDAALVAALAYATASTTLLHGASFRADPLAAFLTMAGLYLAFVTQRAWLAAPFIAVVAICAGAGQTGRDARSRACRAGRARHGGRALCRASGAASGRRSGRRGRARRFGLDDHAR